MGEETNGTRRGARLDLKATDQNRPSPPTFGDAAAISGSFRDERDSAIAKWSGRCGAFRSQRSRSIRPSSSEQPERRKTSLMITRRRCATASQFPPIDVFGNDDGPFYLGDGFHRLEAHRSAHPDAEDIECRVHPGDRDDALLFACGANAQHGLRRSRSDKMKAVTTLFRSERWSGWSDREIARQCGVSHTFVAAVRRDHLETFPDAGPPEDAARLRGPQRDRRTGARRIDDARSGAAAGVTT